MHDRDAIRAAIGTAPARLNPGPMIRGWAALVLTVCTRVRVQPADLLGQQRGRAGQAVAEGRQLLVWAFLSVTDAEPIVATAWLQQCTGLSRRTLETLAASEMPLALQPVVETYERLMQQMSQDDVHEAIAAGVFGHRKRRVRAWPRGYLERLGLQSS